MPAFDPRIRKTVAGSLIWLALIAGLSLGWLVHKLGNRLHDAYFT